MRPRKPKQCRNKTWSKKALIAKLLRFIVISAIVIGFFAHVMESVTKFLEGHTTIALFSETHDAVGPPPSISFCPGLKPHVHDAQDQYGNILKSWNGTVKEEQVLSWWHDITYDFYEVLPTIAHPSFVYSINLPPSQVPGTFSLSNDASITINSIKEVSTLNGRCYTIDFDCELKREEYFTLYFNLSQTNGRLVVFAHEKHNEVGIHEGYWPLKPLAIPLQEHDEASIVFHKPYYITKLEENKCVESERYSYPKCVLDWARGKYLSLDEHNATGLNIPPCQTEPEFSSARNSAAYNIIVHLDDKESTGCLPSCKQTRMKKVEQPVYKTFSQGKAILYLYMSETVETRSEYLLFDTNYIITSVGGSLGLFLEFSCMAVFDMLSKRTLSEECICCF